MKKNLHLILLVLALMAGTAAQADDRQTCIDKGWKFQYGETAGASSPDLDDSAWRTLDLPHDWSVETDAATAAGDNVGPFSKQSPGGRDTGWTIGGIGWYRKAFTLDKGDADKCISLMFEGVYNQAEVWINGIRTYFNHYGYTTFRFDITKFCNAPGKTNVIAVRVTNEGHNSRWYTGSGIYRHVWLMKTPRLHLNEWDTFLKTTSLSDAKAVVEAQTSVRNETAQDKTAQVEVTVYDPSGNAVATEETELAVAAHATVPVNFSLSIASPSRWSPESPRLYRAVMSVKGKGSQEADQTTTKFGLRTIEFSAESGFLLNDQSMLMQGGCVHHDNGLLGAAAYDRAEDRKLQLLKDQGFNAVRCSHNLPSVHFLDACDSIGLLVIDESFDQWLEAKNADDYHNYFSEFSDRDIQTMVRRDRNHPSIVMWSLGNEIPGRIETAGMAAAKRLRNDILRLDDTRPITAAICDWDNYSHSWSDYDNKAFQSLDVGGYNYLYSKYTEDHSTHPNRVMYGSETYPKQASQNWDLVEEQPYVVGDFVWTAMDYLGEAGIGNAGPSNQGYGNNGYGWPWFNGWCGDIDLIGEKKPQSYYRDVVWHRAPITMGVEEPVPSGTSMRISPWGWQLEEQYWTYDGYTDDDIFTVNVYSRSPYVRLYLNDELLGEKATSDTYWAGFYTPYKPGTLRAVCYDGTTEGEAFELKTVGEPVALRMRVDRASIQSDGVDLAYITVELIDKDGQVVYDNERTIHFSIDGNGTLLACGNASPTDQESFRSQSPRLFKGRALAIAKSTETAGQFTVSATSEGLDDQSITVTTTDQPLAIGDIISKAKESERVSTQNHRILIDGRTPDAVYDAQGRAYAPATPLPDGLYVVKANKRAYKVIMK